MRDGAVQRAGHVDLIEHRIKHQPGGPAQPLDAAAVVGADAQIGKRAGLRMDREPGQRIARLRGHVEVLAILTELEAARIEQPARALFALPQRGGQAQAAEVAGPRIIDAVEHDHPLVA